MADVNVYGGQRELYPKHQFLVKIPDGSSAGFQKCSELSAEVAKIEYWEGGSIIPWKVPGRVTVADITLERGASSSRAFYNWLLLCSNFTVAVQTGAAGSTRGAGVLNPGYRKDLKIIQLDRDGQMANAPRVWRIRSAWPQKVVMGDWDNTADEVVMESITLTYDYPELTR